jgi:hypothetical protein
MIAVKNAPESLHGIASRGVGEAVVEAVMDGVGVLLGARGVKVGREVGVRLGVGDLYQ